MKSSLRYPLYVFVHDIRSLHNVGSIFRSADGAGVTKIYLSGYTGIPPRKEIAKVALGAEESVEWEYVQDPIARLDELKKQGFTLVALELTERSMDYRAYTPRGPVCLLVGNEISGVDSVFLKKADVHLKIPMRGIKESLNVSVAFGVAIYSLADRIAA